MQPEPRPDAPAAALIAWRCARVLGPVGLASLAGWGLGALVDLPGTGAWLGALAGAVPVAAVDAWRSIRVLTWLRDPSGREPPALEGRWGEAAYRVERLIKAGEQRVTEERQRLQHFLSAIEASPNGVMLLDAGDHIQWLNSVAAQHFGLSPTRDLQQRLTNLVRNPLFVSHLQSGHFEKPVVFTDAQGQRTLSVVVRAFAENQRLVLSQDVTEALRAEAMRRDFVANVSHEIRTPLTVLSGFIETLDTLDLSAKERRRVLDLMARQAERMQSLVADLLTLAQLEGSPLPAVDRWHDLGGLLQQVADDGRALSAGRQTIEVVLDAAAEVAGNRPELVSAVSNLVNNAVRYTQDGGHIVLRLLARGSGDVEIAVEDNGPGIPREHLSRLTERFYRVDSSRSRETGGTGLGLAIVKHVVQRHGGSLDVDSEVGKGSRFQIVLPASRVRLAALAAGA